MKALTVQQPWAWAIIHGGKDVENRTQAWSHRGPLAIHTGKRWSDRGAESQLMRAAVWNFYGTEAPLNDHKRWYAGEAPGVLGAIIGVVDLVDVHQSITCVDHIGVMCSPWAESFYFEHGPNRETVRRDIVHLVLENPRALDEPIPCRGALGLWTPPSEVLEQLGQVGAA